MLDLKTHDRTIQLVKTKFERNKKQVKRQLENLDISSRYYSELRGQLDSLYNAIDIESTDDAILSRIKNELNKVPSAIQRIYTTHEVSARAEYKKYKALPDTRSQIKAEKYYNQIENLTRSRVNIRKYYDVVKNFIESVNSNIKEYKDATKYDTAKQIGIGAAVGITKSVLGTEGAAIVGGAAAFGRKMLSKKGRSDLKKSFTTKEGRTELIKNTISKGSMILGASLGSPAITIGGAFANEKFSKHSDLKKKQSDILKNIPIITADNSMKGVAHGPTIAGLAMNGKPESFEFTPNKSSVNGVEINQGESKGIVEELKRTNSLLDQNNDILKSLLGISKDTLKFEQDEDKEDELKHKEGKESEFKGFDVKTEKKKEEEDKKGFFAKLKSSVVGFAHSLIPSTGVGWAKLGGGIAGGALGAYGGFKAGKWASSKLGLEEGGTGEKIMEYGGAAAGLAGGAWAGSKLAGKIAGSKFFKKTGLGKLAGGLGGIASDQIARAEADQKVYVTNAGEIGRACQGGGGIIDGAMDMLGGKGKIASKIFKGGIGRSATRLAAKIGGRGFTKTATSLAGKVGGKIPLIGGLIAGGATLASGGSKTEAAGSAAGSMAGAAIGTAILPGIGTIVGGVAGEWIGKKLGGLFNKQNKSEDELYKKEADLMKDKENENKDFFDKLKPGAGAAGGGILGGFFDKLKDTAQAAKQAYSSSREQGGSFFESLGAAKKSGKEVISGKASENRATLLAEMSRAGITDKKEQAMFMGQMRHESGGFAKMSEGKYSAEAVWKLRGSKLAKQGITLAQLKAEEQSQGKEAMWERMYGGRMGNKAPGDGIKYRGRGFVQLTGKSNYAKFGKLIGVDLVNNPDLASDPKIAARIATAYWKDRGLGEKARRGDLEAVTRGIQGGTLHMAERGEAVKKELALLEKGGVPVAPAAAPAAAKPIAKEKPAAKPIAKEKPGKSKGYTDDSLTITQGPVEVGKYGVIASRTEKMPDGTERIYPIYGNPALGPTGAQVEKQIAKDRASILAKMKKGGGKTQAVAAKPQGGTERVVEESKQTYTASEGAQLKRAEAEQERASVAAPAPAVINNVTNNSSRAGTPIPAMHITTGDRDSFPSRLARSY